jgi:hypothetical protein
MTIMFGLEMYNHRSNDEEIYAVVVTTMILCFVKNEINFIDIEDFHSDGNKYKFRLFF